MFSVAGKAAGAAEGQDVVARRARFRVAYDTHHDALKRYLLRRSPTEHDAVRLLDETLIIAWGRLDEIPRGPAARPWLFAIARDVLRDEAQADGWAEAVTTRLIDAVDADGSLAATLRALEALPEPTSELVRVRTWNELSLTQTADLFDCADNAVPQRLARAERQLTVGGCDDPLDLLADSVPFEGDTVGPTPTDEREQRFTTVTATDVSEPVGDGSDADVGGANRRSGIGLREGAVASVLVFIAVAALVLLSWTDRPSDFATINEAAIATAGFTSGDITTNVKIREATGVPETAQIEVARTFDRDDERIVVTTDGFGGRPFDTTLPLDGVLEHRRVDGVGYLRRGDGDWTLDEAGILDELAALVGAQPQQGDPSAMVRLIRLSEDLDQVTTDEADGDVDIAIFRGTVSREALATLDRSALPLGVALVAETPSGLSDQLPIDVVIEDANLAQVDLRIQGRTVSGGFIDATIITTYSGLGARRSISAPPADAIAIAPALAARSAMDEQTAFDTLTELAERRPDLCGVIRSEPVDEVREGELEGYARRLSDCYAAAGELAAADAAPVLILGPAD